MDVSLLIVLPVIDSSTLAILVVNDVSEAVVLTSSIEILVCKDV